MVNVVSKLIDTLYGNLEKTQDYYQYHWISDNYDVIFTYDERDGTLFVLTDLITDIIKTLGVEYKHLKPILLSTLEDKLGVNITYLRIF